MSAPTQPPEYKGAPLDAERGPGLGCFWIQVALLTFFLVLTPLTVTWGWDPFISGALLIFTLILLLFTGQTVIFLLRLVAADRRTRRAPLDPAAKKTVGQLEDEPAPADDGSATGTEDLAPAEDGSATGKADPTPTEGAPDVGVEADRSARGPVHDDAHDPASTGQNPGPGGDQQRTGGE